MRVQAQPYNELQGVSAEELVEKYTPLIRSIAAQIKNRLSLNVEFEDLISYGRLGLLEAAERFDFKLGVSFKTFAYYRIKGAIYDGLRKMEVITRRKDPRLKFEEAANQILAADATSAPPDPRNKPTLKDEIEELRNVISSLVPIYFLAHDALDRLQKQEDNNSAEQQAAQTQQKEALQQALNKLNKNERTLIENYYYRDMTLEQAAAQLGLSKSWASRLHAKAIAKLRNAFVVRKKWKNSSSRK